MSTQMCRPAAYSHLDELLSIPVFNDQAVENFIDTPIDGFHNNSPIDNSATSDTFAPSLLDYDQNISNIPLYGGGEFGMSNIDPNFVSTIVNGSAPFADQSQFDLSPTIDFTNLNESSNATNQLSTSPSPNTVQEPKKRRSRKKKAPLPLEVQEKKRKTFLEKNRVAARKCRDKNRKKWDGIQEKLDMLKTVNKALREECRELVEEMGRLKDMAAKHGSCGHEGLQTWIDGHKNGSDALEFAFEAGIQGSAQDAMTPDGEDHDMRAASASPSTHDTATQSPSSHKEDSNVDIDMAFFVEDKVPYLSASRDSSLASTSSTASSPSRKISSPADSGIDMDYGKASTDNNQRSAVVGLDDDLIRDTSLFELCHFTGHEDLPRTGPMIW